MLLAGHVPIVIAVNVLEFQGEDGVLGSQSAKPREVIGTETLE
jgi:hypothetical protein